MRKIYALVAAVVVAGLAANAVAAPMAVYDPASGGISLNEVANVGGISLKGPNLRTNPAPDALGGFVDTSIAGEISWLFFVPKNGNVPLGNLLPAGLLQSTLASQYFAGVVIQGSGVADPQALPLTGGIIPEPGTFAMAGLALVGVVGAARRRRA